MFDLEFFLYPKGEFHSGKFSKLYRVTCENFTQARAKIAELRAKYDSMGYGLGYTLKKVQE